MKPELSDKELNAILDNPEADRKLSAIAVKRAIARGLSQAEAKRLYG